MKFLILLSAIFVFSELHRAESAAWYQIKCGAFVDDPKQSFSTFDKYCYESNPDVESFCFGNIYGATECSDIMVNNIHEGIRLLFDVDDSPMVFNKLGEGKCQYYHPDYLENLAWSLGYSNYRVDRNKSGNNCQFASLDRCGKFQINVESGAEANSIEAPYDVSFWGKFEPTCEDGKLNQCETDIDCGGPCPPCAPVSNCPWLTPTDQYNLLHCMDGTFCNAGTDSARWKCCDEHKGRAKCPKNSPLMCADENGCAEGSDYCCEREIGDCTGGLRKCEEAPKDDCSKFDGILHKHRAVCCNKKCQKCGGVQGKCGKLTDEEGNVLGKDQCCGKRIEESGITCGSDGSKAPCKLPTPRK